MSWSSGGGLTGLGAALKGPVVSTAAASGVYNARVRARALCYVSRESFTSTCVRVCVCVCLCVWCVCVRVRVRVCVKEHKENITRRTVYAMQNYGRGLPSEYTYRSRPCVCVCVYVCV